jgi:hypothetical protein
MTGDGLYLGRKDSLMKFNFGHWQLLPGIQAIFPVNSVGIVTARDHLTIHWTSHQVWTTVLNFISLEPDIARQAYQLGNDARDWKVKLAQEDLKKSGPTKQNVVPTSRRRIRIGRSEEYGVRFLPSCLKGTRNSYCHVIASFHLDTRFYLQIV